MSGTGKLDSGVLENVTLTNLIFVFFIQLKTALSEAQKNASLLAEYHDLYELQRKRLETSVHLLTEERELWSNAAYSLALKVHVT
jgi:hypothetical protein